MVVLVLAKRRAPRVREGWLPGVVATALLCMAVGGCGGVLSPDLFVVSRTSTTPEASVSLRVNEEGGGHCGRDPAHPGPPRHLSDPQIIEARTIQEGLHDPASHHSSLPAAPGSVLRYYVRDQEGWARFADNSSTSIANAIREVRTHAADLRARAPQVREKLRAEAQEQQLERKAAKQAARSKRAAAAKESADA